MVIYEELLSRPTSDWKLTGKTIRLPSGLEVKETEVRCCNCDAPIEERIFLVGVKDKLHEPVVTLCAACEEGLRTFFASPDSRGRELFVADVALKGWGAPQFYAAPAHVDGWTERLRRTADRCFSPKTNSLVLAPTLDDLDLEYSKALAESGLWRARRVLLRGCWSFAAAIATHLAISALVRLRSRSG